MLLMEYDYTTDIEVQREEAFEKGVNKGIQQGVSQGEHQAKIETAKNMLKDKLDIETIIKYTGLPLETIQSLK
jgi:predicted transposase/invertase (TIGR01784 family)